MLHWTWSVFILNEWPAEAKNNNKIIIIIEISIEFVLFQNAFSDGRVACLFLFVPRKEK